MTNRPAACLAVLASLALGCDEERPGAPEHTEFRIVGGGYHEGDPAVPYLLVYDGHGDQPMSVCSGTLIGARTVLTAAHCVDRAVLGFEPYAIEAYFGTEYSNNDPGFAFYTDAVSFVVHEGWNGNADPSNGNDIALIDLAEDVPIEPMPIARQPLSNADLGGAVRLVGWGITRGGGQDSGLKRMVYSELYDFDGGLVEVGSSASNTCSGDSGGPAFMNIGGKDVVVGVTSFGDQYCEEYGVSTRVDAFADWIDAAMGGAPTDPSGGDGSVGATCSDGDECDSGLCVEVGGGGMCTDACDGSKDCPGGWECFETEEPGLNVCAPTDGNGNIDPDAAKPGDDDDDGDDDDGDGDDDDGEDDDEDEDDDDDGSHGGGCNVAGQQGPATLALLTLVGFLRRRRRGSAARGRR